MQNKGLLRIEGRVELIVTHLYESPELPFYPYHNLAHTQSVVKHVREIGAHYQLGPAEMSTLLIAAWFHDVGHLYGQMKGHEEWSVAIMEHYLSDIDPGWMADISRYILATRFPNHPIDLPEQIICDADTYHLGTPLFRQTDPLVHQEMELRKGVTLGDWSRKTLELLRRHIFFTDYCKVLLEQGKAENIAWVEAAIVGP